MNRTKLALGLVAFGVLVAPGPARSLTTVFFNAAQTTNLVAAGTTSDTISSEGYLFTLTMDKLFTGGVGLTNPIGRALRVFWPDGLEAQAVTAGPLPSGAKIVITRQDAQPFAIQSFTARLLANTAGAGGSFEIMPQLNGQDAFTDPFMYDATGYYGNNFTYSTPQLTGFDSYIVSLYVDFALMNLTVVDASLPPPFLEIAQLGGASFRLSWPTNDPLFILESAAGLPAANWAAITNSVTVNGDVFTVQLEAAQSHQWFRLRK